MGRCIFAKPEPIQVTITLTKADIVAKAVSILNKMAEARYDGTNAQYVNNMQPEIDFEQDAEIIDGFYEDGLMRIIKRIEPYVLQGEAFNRAEATYVLYLQFPENWKRQFESLLRKRIEDYIVYMIIAHWLEKVSMADTAYTMDKADELLYELRHTCDMRQGTVHRGWNTTYSSYGN